MDIILSLISGVLGGAIETFFHVYAKFIGAGAGFMAAIILAYSDKLIPWGLRLPRKARHPFKDRPAINNGLNQHTTSREEWWGEKLRILGCVLLSISFFIQLLVEWPIKV